MNTSDPNTEVGSLERMGIPLETIVDQNIITPSAAKAVRFRISKPQGYAFNEVDNYMENIVNPSLEWYVTVLHQRDKEVHALGTALDKAEVDIQNLRSQIQFLDYNKPAAEAISKGQDDKEVAALMQRLQEATAEINRLQAANSQPLNTAFNETELNARIQELETYIETVTDQYNRLLEQYNEVAQQLETALAASTTDSAAGSSAPVDDNIVSQLEEHIQVITDQYNQLYAQYNELEQQLETALASNASGAVAPSNDSETEARVVELETYIETVTDQYNQLLEQYNVVVEQVSSGGAEIADDSEVASLRQENNDLLEKIAYLENRVRVLESKQPEQEEKPKPGIMLATEERNREIPETVSKKYGQLPPGIRLDDLE